MGAAAFAAIAKAIATCILQAVVNIICTATEWSGLATCTHIQLPATQVQVCHLAVSCRFVIWP